MLHLVAYVQYTHNDWYQSYMESKPSHDRGLDSLVHLLRAFCHLHGFSRRVACPSKLRQDDLGQIQLDFAGDFTEKYDGYEDHAILNADETDIDFDLPSGFTWAGVGRTSKTNKTQKHSDRISVVLTVRADGSKLPLLFIVRGAEDGVIEHHEIESYPKPHVLVVQRKAWMDIRVWDVYLKELFVKNVEEPSVLLVDNLEAHGSEASYSIVHDACCSSLQALPKNSTSVCQLLDVGVMGPFKSKLRREWLKEEVEKFRLGTANVSMTAKEKRMASIKRAIRVWNEFDEGIIVKAFKKAIPTVYK
ncbi:hypothetical protein AeNC1_014132, partial [Aphanomyces euteiches]